MKPFLVIMVLMSRNIANIGFAGQRGAEIFSTQCEVCHGNAGIDTEAPIRFGQEPAYIVKSLVAFKHGHRKDRIMTVMNAIAAALSDDDIRELAFLSQGRVLAEWI